MRTAYGTEVENLLIYGQKDSGGFDGIARCFVLLMGSRP